VAYILSGGTVDVTLREVEDDRLLKELHRPTGGPWGGVTVDAAFIALLESAVGSEVWEKFSRENKPDLLDLELDFEQKKCYVEVNETTTTSLKIPLSLLETYVEVHNKKLTSEDIMDGKIRFNKDKMFIDAEVMRGLFREAIGNTVEHVATVLSDVRKSATNLKTIFLVGGFSECELVRDAIRSSCPKIKVIWPKEEAGMAVLKGAVLYGHKPWSVRARVSRYTYGTSALRYFMKDEDPEDKRTVVDGVPYCKDVFVKHVEAGQLVVDGDGTCTEVFPVSADQRFLSIKVYAVDEYNPSHNDPNCGYKDLNPGHDEASNRSEDPVPRYVTEDNCRLLGRVSLHMPDTSKGKERKVFVKLYYGGTEITVEGVDEDSGETVTATFDLL
jgi:hypothetical protein